MRDRLFWPLFVGLSAIPALWLACLYGVGLVGSVQLGRWPAHTGVDPKAVALGPLDDAVRVLFLAGLCSVVCWPIAALFFLRRPGLWHMAVLYGVGLVLCVVQVKVDPFGLLFWFMD